MFGLLSQTSDSWAKEPKVKSGYKEWNRKGTMTGILRIAISDTEMLFLDHSFKFGGTIWPATDSKSYLISKQSCCATVSLKPVQVSRRKEFKLPWWYHYKLSGENDLVIGHWSKAKSKWSKGKNSGICSLPFFKAIYTLLTHCVIS